MRSKGLDRKETVQVLLVTVFERLKIQSVWDRLGEEKRCRKDGGLTSLLSDGYIGKDGSCGWEGVSRA